MPNARVAGIGVCYETFGDEADAPMLLVCELVCGLPAGVLASVEAPSS
jgi:hypothetical protein